MTILVRRSPLILRTLGRRYASDAAPKETLVVVGGGWAGYNFVRKLDKVSSTAVSERPR
jgi:hypothetical protein